MEVMFKKDFSWKCPDCGFKHEHWPDPTKSNNIRCIECGAEFDQIEWIESENLDEPESASDLIGMFFVKALCISMLFFAGYKMFQM